MKSLQKDLQAIVKELKSLTRTTERLSGKLSKLEAAGSPKAKRKSPRRRTKSEGASGGVKTKKASAVDLVFTAIKMNKKGADMAQIKAKTGFNDRKIWNVVYRLKKGGKIKATERGVYMPI